jgi:exodeoxyribonuclease V alpha subunit
MLMNRNLLYTAVTRAKSCVMMLGSREAVSGMIRNEEQLARFTGLSDQIKETFDSLDLQDDM